MPDRLPFLDESWDNLEATFTAATARSVCGSGLRNSHFREYHTNPARGESKTPVSSNRGEIGGKDREHEKRMPMKLDSKIAVYLG